MPNHVNNYLTFSSRTDEIRAFLKSDESIVDFNKVIPRPEDLEIESSSTLGTWMDIIEKLGEDSNELLSLKYYLNDEGKNGLELGLKGIQNKKTYGYATWYEWSWDNWGTKWNAYDCVDEEWGLAFDTAWEYPEPIIKKLSEMFPDVEITDEVDGEIDMPFTIVWKNGKEIRYEEHPYTFMEEEEMSNVES